MTSQSFHQNFFLSLSSRWYYPFLPSFLKALQGRTLDINSISGSPWNIKEFTLSCIILLFKRYMPRTYHCRSFPETEDFGTNFSEMLSPYYQIYSCSSVLFKNSLLLRPPWCSSAWSFYPRGWMKKHSFEITQSPLFRCIEELQEGKGKTQEKNVW